MQTKDWTTVDRTGWGSGPWDGEPDKRQWQDEATGLPCLIVRTTLGHLCGYVGVPEGHLLHGKGYSETVPALAEALERRKEQPVGEEPGMAILAACVFGGDLEPKPEVAINIHGGLTFSDRCRSHTREDWARFRSRVPEMRQRAAVHPHGDAASALRAWGPAIDSYETFVELSEARDICHVREECDPEAWWFGFDCAHCDDHSPGMRSVGFNRGGTYRDIGYVTEQCRSLAKQLAAVAGEGG